MHSESNLNWTEAVIDPGLVIEHPKMCRWISESELPLGTGELAERLMDFLLWFSYIKIWEEITPDSKSFLLEFRALTLSFRLTMNFKSVFVIQWSKYKKFLHLDTKNFQDQLFKFYHFPTEFLWPLCQKPVDYIHECLWALYYRYWQTYSVKG